MLHSSAGLYGADRQLMLLATGLNRERYRPLVALPQEGELVQALRAANVPVLVRPLAVLRRELMTARGLVGLAAAWARDARALASVIRSQGVALVHSNTSVTLGGAPASALGRVPHVWHVREIYTGHRQAWRLHRRLLGTAAALPCVSEAARGALGISGAALIRDGLALRPAAATPQQRSAARHRIGLEEDQVAVLLAGRLSHWKGQDVLVRALADPALRDVRAVALLAGAAWRDDPAPGQQLLALARAQGVGERVRLLGFFDEMSVLYAAADVVVVPSTLPDPLPNSALEAAAAGCCVVASRIGGLPEIISDGKTGALVAPGDPGALAACLAGLAANPALRARLGAAAALDVSARFAPERLLSSVQALYDRVLSGRA